MKDQRWPNDYRTIGEELAYSKREEQRGMNDANRSRGNDYLALGTTRQLDAYDLCELESSACQQLDTVGMQPHSREYLERDATMQRSARKLMHIDGQSIDYPAGIHFDEMP